MLSMIVQVYTTFEIATDHLYTLGHALHVNYYSAKQNIWNQFTFFASEKTMSNLTFDCALCDPVGSFQIPIIYWM